MTSFKFRIKPQGWAHAVIGLSILAVCGIALALTYKTLLDMAALSGRMVLFLFLPPLIIYLGALWFASPVRVIQISNGQLVLSDGRGDLDRIMIQDIAHVRITGMARTIELFDRTGRQRFALTPNQFTQAQGDKALDYLRTLAPHIENREEFGKRQNKFTNRYVDFPPPVPR
ncbi:MAG: hypothetical protein Q4D79_12240 [Propionibacteriaceae bacterium]|nr:hypothetical protein [Propionibacteriaceae bacterium]